LLLVFFMCSFSFKTNEVHHDSNLPKDMGVCGGPIREFEHSTLVVRVNSDGAASYTCNTRSPGDLESAKEWLRSLPADALLSIDMREGTVYGQFMELYDYCVGLGIAPNVSGSIE